VRIPKKKELLELQRKYRTDKKIGDVYGVPARLVAYWRSKKKIGSYSYPKYSEEKIQELWERYGDDSRAGTELGISGAGFRQWRRKYGLKSKPVQLRLEQLELGLIDPAWKKNARRETAAQKILARKSGLKRVEVGEIVDIEPDLVVSNDSSEQVIGYLSQMGIDKIWHPSKIVVVLDQRMPLDSAESSETHRIIREFVKRNRIRSFYDVGEGVSHHVVLENGHILPGQLALGTDSQAASFGSLGAFSTSISMAEMAAVWATGKIWTKVPSTVKVVLNGRLGRGVFGKDIILKLRRDLPRGAVNYRTVELHGSAMAGMSLSERFHMTGSMLDMGVKSAMVPFDDVTARYLKKITKTRLSPVRTDPNADYEDEFEFDLSYLTPQVALADGVKGVVPVEEAAGRRIDQVVIGSCTSGGTEDLAITAGILRGRRIHRDLRMIVVPGSRRILSGALDKGYIKTLVDSGCLVVSPGCWMCPVAHRLNLARGERILASGTGAFPDQKGVNDSEIYLASVATAAATALEGVITDPRKYLK
jgi:3-isopropylmalate/(R)-2-methylmalate dehydratase large subunit